MTKDNKIKKFTHINKIKSFIKEVWSEVNPKTGKVSWPSKKVILGSTLVVLILISIVSLYIFIVDMLSAGIMSLIIGR